MKINFYINKIKQTQNYCGVISNTTHKNNENDDSNSSQQTNKNLFTVKPAYSSKGHISPAGIILMISAPILVGIIILIRKFKK